MQVSPHGVIPRYYIYDVYPIYFCYVHALSITGSPLTHSDVK